MWIGAVEMNLSAIWLWVKSVIAGWEGRLSLTPDSVDTGCELISLCLHSSIFKMEMSLQVKPLSWLYYEEWTDDTWKALETVSDSVVVYYNYYSLITETHTKNIHKVLLDSTAFSAQFRAWPCINVLISTLSKWLDIQGGGYRSTTSSLS